MCERIMKKAFGRWQDGLSQIFFIPPTLPSKPSYTTPQSSSTNVGTSVWCSESQLFHPFPPADLSDCSDFQYAAENLHHIELHFKR